MLLHGRSNRKVREMKNPKVSVLTPLYNTPLEHLKETVDSILNQTFTDFEYLILNDSPDNKELDAFIASYDDARIRYIKNKKNIGLEASTNKLLDEARGEYVAILDHDDISLPERLEKEVAYLDKHPKAGVVSAQFRVFGVQTWVSNNPLKNHDIKEALETASCLSHTTSMMRKSVLDKHSIRYEKDFFPAASYRILTQIALVSDVGNLPDVLVEYRMDGNNTSIRHAEERVVAREKLREEYIEGRRLQWLKDKYHFDTAELLSKFPINEERRHYRAAKDGELFFVKTDRHDLQHEYTVGKRMFEKDATFFVEPVAYYKGSPNYLITKWDEGLALDEVISKGGLTKSQKSQLVDDLLAILTLLRGENLVHRDILPRNFLVTSKGRLKLIDFHFAVESDNYEELEYVKDDVNHVRYLGEKYAYGVYRWDDAYSFVKVAEDILGSKDLAKKNASVKKMTSYIGERIIYLDGNIVVRNMDETRDRFIEMAEELHAQLQGRDKIIAELNSEIAHRNAVIEQLETSKSYKVGRKLTRPVRALRRIKNTRTK